MNNPRRLLPRLFSNRLNCSLTRSVEGHSGGLVHCWRTRRNPREPLGIVTVVVVWLPPEEMPLARVVKLPAASVGEVSTEYVAPGIEDQVSVKWRLRLLYCHAVIVGGGGAVSIKTKLSK